MLISRRTMLLGGLAATAAACTTRSALGESGQPSVELVGPGEFSPTDQLAESIDTVVGVPESVMVVGDSISAGSRDEIETVLTGLGFAEVSIDAEPSRRITVGKSKPTNGLAIIQYVEGAQPPDLWVIELGTNDAGQYSSSDDYRALIDDVLDVIDDRVDLVWVNVYRRDHVDASELFNDTLRSRLSARGNATIVDWYSQCLANADDLLSDGVHPNEAGRLVLASMIAAGVQSRID